jgi:hypothetical protein
LKSGFTEAEPAWLGDDVIADPPTAEELEYLAQSLRVQDPVLADQYGRMLATWDVVSYLESANRYVEDPEQGDPGRGFCTLLGGLLTLMVAFTANKPVTVPQIQAAARQVRGALAARPPVDRQRVREAYVAMLCHFVVLRQTGLAGFSSQDTQVMGEVTDMFSEWSTRLFDGDILDCEIRDDGFHRATRAAP